MSVLLQSLISEWPRYNHYIIYNDQYNMIGGPRIFVYAERISDLLYRQVRTCFPDNRKEFSFVCENNIDILI